MTKNTGSNKTEFLLHVKDEYDYRFKCAKLQELSDSIKEVYFNLMNDNLQIFGVSKNIASYMTTKSDMKKKVNKLPDEIYRQYDEDVYEPFEESEFNIEDKDIDEMNVEDEISTPIMMVSELIVPISACL